MTDTLLVWQSLTMANEAPRVPKGAVFEGVREDGTFEFRDTDGNLIAHKIRGVSVSFEEFVEPCILIAQIIDRLLALSYWRDTGATPPPRDELVATLTTAHHDCPHTCNLARIMELDDASLRHDVLGFYRYTDVESGEFNECGPFWPLSAE